MNLEALIKTMPDKVQVMVRATHFQIDQHTRVYWQKAMVERDRIAPIIDICENGVSKQKTKKSEDSIKMKDLEDKIGLLERKNKELDKKNKDLKAQIDEVKSIYDQGKKVANSLP
jgi:hypothetical protein